MRSGDIDEQGRYTRHVLALHKKSCYVTFMMSHMVKQEEVLMNVSIKDARMSKSAEDGFVGAVHFEVEGHQQAYEMTLQSKRGKDWGYGLFFLSGSGNEEQLLEVEDEIEENDELFESLIEAGMSALAE